MKKSVLITLGLLAWFGVRAQDDLPPLERAPLFRVNPLPEINDELSSSFFLENRERLRDTLPDSGMVVLFSAPVRYSSNDIEYRYQQDKDFYYFTGIDAENAMLVLFDSPVKINDKWYREIDHAVAINVANGVNAPTKIIPGTQSTADGAGSVGYLNEMVQRQASNSSQNPSVALRITS